VALDCGKFAGVLPFHAVSEHDAVMQFILQCPLRTGLLFQPRSIGDVLFRYVEACEGERISPGICAASGCIAPSVLGDIDESAQKIERTSSPRTSGYLEACVKTWLKASVSAFDCATR
jgi:hypothetical protein